MSYGHANEIKYYQNVFLFNGVTTIDDLVRHDFPLSIGIIVKLSTMDVQLK